MAVDVVGTLERVRLPGLERLFAKGPADKVFSSWGLERVWAITMVN